jgi:hypothetical protein
VLRAPGDDTSRLAQALRHCITRPGTAKEIQVLRDLLSDSRAYYKTHADEAKLTLGTHAAPGVSAEENAAWIATARIILNMDEFITRE